MDGYTVPGRAYVERLTHQCERVPITALNRATPRCCETSDQFAFKVVCSRRPPRLPCHPTHTSSRLPHSLSALTTRRVLIWISKELLGTLRTSQLFSGLVLNETTHGSSDQPSVQIGKNRHYSTRNTTS